METNKKNHLPFPSGAKQRERNTHNPRSICSGILDCGVFKRFPLKNHPEFLAFTPIGLIRTAHTDTALSGAWGLRAREPKWGLSAVFSLSLYSFLLTLNGFASLASCALPLFLHSFCSHTGPRADGALYLLLCLLPRTISNNSPQFLQSPNLVYVCVCVFSFSFCHFSAACLVCTQRVLKEMDLKS